MAIVLKLVAEANAPNAIELISDAVELVPRDVEFEPVLYELVPNAILPVSVALAWLPNAIDDKPSAEALVPSAVA